MTIRKETHAFNTITRKPYPPISRLGLAGVVVCLMIGQMAAAAPTYRVNTAHDKTVLTGDTISLLGNFERNIPLGIFSDRQECIKAIKKIREKADIVLPAHDPLTLERWPDGIIGICTTD